MGTCAVTVAIPTYGRADQLADTLRRILACDPAPDEVIVHIDGGDGETASRITREFSQVKLIRSEDRVGPGGGRNRINQAASNDIVASFDDDSYPLDSDYFSRACSLFSVLPDAAVIAANVSGPGSAVANAQEAFSPYVNFEGCGVVYRRRAMIAAGGYVPLRVAYGMEEVDLCLRLVALEAPIYFSPWLRVFHDNDLTHHASARITSASIANLALLVFLRYPVRFWLYGAAQIANRIQWLVRVGRWAGILTGIASIPRHLAKHRALRAPVSARSLRTFLRMRRQPINLQALPRRD